jgi:ABC-type lipoprotein release transport system permease subunit
MKQQVVLAFRNLFRSPKRSFALLLLMCMSFLALTLIKAGYADMFARIKKSFTASRGDLSFTLSGAEGMRISEYAAFKEGLIRSGRVSAVKAAVPVQGLVGTDSGSAPISGYAVEGAFADRRGEEGSIEAELGIALAGSLGLTEGEEFSGLINGSGFSFRVAKVVRTEAKARDRFFLNMPLEALAEREPGATVGWIGMWIAGGPEVKTDSMRELMSRPELAAYASSAYELGDTEVNSIVRVYEDNFNVVLIVVAATMLLALANVSLLSAWERGPEWGTMLALGSRFASLGAVMVFEALILALAAAAAGGILTLAVSAIVNAAGGISLPPPPTATGPIRIGFKPEWSAFALASSVSALCALAAALMAVRRVRRSSIIELLFERN